MSSHLKRDQHAENVSWLAVISTVLQKQVSSLSMLKSSGLSADTLRLKNFSEQMQHAP